MHMAVAVGTPVVCLIGVTDPERNGPLDSRSCVVLPPLPHRWTYRRKGENRQTSSPLTMFSTQYGGYFQQPSGARRKLGSGFSSLRAADLVFFKFAFRISSSAFENR